MCKSTFLQPLHSHIAQSSRTNALHGLRYCFLASVLLPCINTALSLHYGLMRKCTLYSEGGMPTIDHPLMVDGEDGLSEIIDQRSMGRFRPKLVRFLFVQCSGLICLIPVVPFGRFVCQHSISTRRMGSVSLLFPCVQKPSCSSTLRLRRRTC